MVSYNFLHPKKDLYNFSSPPKHIYPIYIYIYYDDDDIWFNYNHNNPWIMNHSCWKEHQRTSVLMPSHSQRCAPLKHRPTASGLTDPTWPSFWGFYRDFMGILWGFQGNFRGNLGECDWEGKFIVTWRGSQTWVLTNDSGRPSDSWEIPALAVFSVAGKIIKPLLGKFPKSHVWLS